jgi:outer membrane lipoprotein SlyB
MITVAGIFSSPQLAQRAAAALRRTGLTKLNLLLPGATDKQVDAVPTSATEQPGMGATVGSVVGGALGLAGGLGLGSAAATILIPGVGPVLAVGMAAAAIFGVGGAVTGAAAGAALEESSTAGLPTDELFVYKDALCKGKSILFVQAHDADDAERASSALAAAGAESIDAAREQHWIGLRSAEREHYQKLGGDFEKDEYAYRLGFETALAQNDAGNPPVPERSAGEAFRCGYERGLAHRRSGRQP